MKALRARAKKTLKKKYNKAISLSDVDGIWAAWVKYSVVNPMLTHGFVQIDDNTTIQIVGTKIDNDNAMLGLMERGLNVNGIVKPAVRFDSNRIGVKYKIVLTDKNYKGTLIFEANPRLSKRVSEELRNTQTYYKILS